MLLDGLSTDASHDEASILLIPNSEDLSQYNESVRECYLPIDRILINRVILHFLRDPDLKGLKATGCHVEQETGKCQKIFPREGKDLGLVFPIPIEDIYFRAVLGVLLVVSLWPRMKFND